MPKHTRPETVTFAAGLMKKKPDITMAELSRLGKPKGYNIYGLIMGLARRELGMKRKTPVRGAAKRGPGRPPGRRGPGRPRKSITAGLDLGGIVAYVKGLERDAEALRNAIERIAALASEG